MRSGGQFEGQPRLSKRHGESKEMEGGILSTSLSCYNGFIDFFNTAKCASAYVRDTRAAIDC